VHADRAAFAPEVLLCAETQERFCWAVPASFADELCDLYNREFALGAIYPGAGARVVGVATRDGRYGGERGRASCVVDCPVDAITSVARSARRYAAARPPLRASRAARRSSRTRRCSRCSRPGAAASATTSSITTTRRCRGARGCGRARETPRSSCPRPGARSASRSPWAAAVVVRRGPRARRAPRGRRAARKVACVGGRPWALTDCLNFGSPEDPEVMGDLEATLEGLSLAAEALGGLAAPGLALPFVSGNVSLYNQTGAHAIPPSPIVMCAGVVKEPAASPGLALGAPGAFSSWSASRATR
jgi:phosphoribosylformylglycinamidine (FGAM) synthase-like enzyme